MGKPGASKGGEPARVMNTIRPNVPMSSEQMLEIVGLLANEAQVRRADEEDSAGLACGLAASHIDAGQSPIAFADPSLSAICVVKNVQPRPQV